MDLCWLIYVLFFTLCKIGNSYLLTGKNDYEQLTIVDLPNGFLFLEFTFKLSEKLSKLKTAHHFQHFPQPIGEIISRYHVEEFHFSLVQGIWDNAKWDMPHLYSSAISPPGAQLWVRFSSALTESAVNQHWSGFTNSLSGQFCASGNQLATSDYAITPYWSFASLGAEKSAGYERLARLPKEAVCTENLTPWWKLLPCKNQAGLGRLLSSVNLFNGAYQGLRMLTRPDIAAATMETQLHFSVVLDRRLLSAGKLEWSLQSLLGKSLTSVCPLMDNSYVRVLELKDLRLTPAPSRHVTSKSKNRVFAVYDLTSNNLPLHLSASYATKMLSYGNSVTPNITFEKYMVSKSHDVNGIHAVIRNNFDRSMHFLYVDQLPSVFRFLASSFKTTFKGKEKLGANSGLIDYHFTPGKLRKRSTKIELLLRLPPKSTLCIDYLFSKAFQRWTEFPPDANHGVMLPSAALRISHSRTMTYDNSFYLYSETILVPVPTPDFSMPYNVICLVCTIIAIAFGSMHNVSCRSLLLYPTASKKFSLSSILSKIFKKSN